MYYRKARNISYGKKRKYNDIKFLIIHYTGNVGDSAKNNADYFATSNTRTAGAHYFISSDGTIAKSIPINLTAYSVGDGKSGKYGQIATNGNSINVELCDASKGFTRSQAQRVAKLKKRLEKKCGHKLIMITHYDVSKKNCPPWHDGFQTFVEAVRKYE